MSNFKQLNFLHNGDYFTYENKIYKVDWTLDESYNVIRVKTEELDYIEPYTRVKWLRNFENIKLIR